MLIVELALAGSAWLWGSLLEWPHEASTFIAELTMELVEEIRFFASGIYLALSVVTVVTTVVFFVSLGSAVFIECRRSWRGLAANKESLRVSIGHFEETCDRLAADIRRENSTTKGQFEDLNDFINAIRALAPGKKAMVPEYVRRLADNWVGHSPAYVGNRFIIIPGFPKMLWNGLDEEFLSMLAEQDRLRKVVRMNNISK